MFSHKSGTNCQIFFGANPVRPFAPAYYNSGTTYDKKVGFNRTIADFNKAGELDPKFELAFKPGPGGAP